MRLDKLQDSPIWPTDLQQASFGPRAAECRTSAHFPVASKVALTPHSSGCSFTSHGFSWTHRGGLTDLGVLPGAQYSFAYGVNSTGQIVGTGDDSSSAVVALLWTGEGTIHDLNTLIAPGIARTLVSANAINDAGQIGECNREKRQRQLRPALDADHDHRPRVVAESVRVGTSRDHNRDRRVDRGPATERRGSRLQTRNYRASHRSTNRRSGQLHYLYPHRRSAQDGSNLRRRYKLRPSKALVFTQVVDK
jgi:probable HAF family extracellular repeat protein